ncbi:MAG: hypothetical protein ABR987_15435 [Terracidiphilus sp.]|jgi:hypothetical protein
MNTTKNTARGPVSTAAADKQEVVVTITNLYSKSVERIAELQKKGIDMAVEQNAELLNACKNVSQTVPGASSLFMLDLAASAFARYADTQKGAIDLVLEQSHALAGLVKERAASSIKAGESAAAVLLQAVEQAVVLQKKALDNSAAQGKADLDRAKHYFGLTGTPAEQLAESFQHGMDSMIATQKTLLDIAAKPFTTVN